MADVTQDDSVERRIMLATIVAEADGGDRLAQAAADLFIGYKNAGWPMKVKNVNGCSNGAQRYAMHVPPRWLR